MAEVTLESIAKLLDDKLKAVVTREYLDDKLKEFPTTADLNTLKMDVADIKETLNHVKQDTNAYAKDIVRLDNAVSRIQKHLKLRTAS